MKDVVQQQREFLAQVAVEDNFFGEYALRREYTRLRDVPADGWRVMMVHDRGPGFIYIEPDDRFGFPG